MKVYRTDEIRNVVLLGHGGSGKTSLVEAMLYVSGATNRMGKVTEANTVSDFDKEEIWVYKGDLWFNKQTVIHEMGHFVELCMVGDGISDEDFIRERDELIEIIRKYAGSSRNEAYAEIWYEICKYGGNLDRDGLRELSESCKGCFWEVYEDWLRFEEFDSEGVRVRGI